MSDDPRKPVVNIADVPLRDFGNGGAFAAKIGSFGRTIGLSGLGASVTVVEPGKRAYPFHVHHQTHEMFIILEGEGTYRFGGESYPIKANDVLAAPIGGPEFAHQIINTGTTTLRYLAISANFVGGDVVEYPDSNKFSVSSRFNRETMTSALRFVGRAETSLAYWDGEDIGEEQ